jgi:hypothetical protein
MKRLALSFLLVLLAMACGDDRTTSAAVISATAGGTVRIGTSETRLEVPPNSLAMDTEIVATIDEPAGYPAQEGLREVLVLEPAGTALEIPATLMWKPAGDALTGTERLSLLELVDGAWLPRDVSVTVGSGGVVSTTVGRLGTYGLAVRPAPMGETGTIAGSVIHIYTEAPLPGIRVTLYEQTERMVGTATSASDGTFSFADVPVGSYFLVADVTPENNCFNDPTNKPAEVTAGATTPVTFAFVPGPCG